MESKLKAVHCVVLAALLLGCDRPGGTQRASPGPVEWPPYSAPEVPKSVPDLDRAFDYFNQKYVEYDPRDVYRRGHKKGYSEGLLVVWKQGAKASTLVPVGVRIHLSGTSLDSYWLDGIYDGCQLCVDEYCRAEQRRGDPIILKQMVAERFTAMTGEDVAEVETDLMFRVGASGTIIDNLKTLD